jgi:uncharacterized coiled-coil protein SlyX
MKKSDVDEQRLKTLEAQRADDAATIKGLVKRAEAAEAKYAEISEEHTKQVKEVADLRALADRLAETAREVIEERESYWGSTDGIRRHDPEHAALMDALAAYEAGEPTDAAREGERDG